MSPGNAGTTIASGVDSIALSAIGTKSAIEVDIVDQYLAPGTYWLQVAPVGTGSISGTDGSNSIGTTPALNSIRNWPLFSQIYQPYSDFTLSSGVTGSVVPVPAAVWFFGSGLLGLVGIARRKKA